MRRGVDRECTEGVLGCTGVRGNVYEEQPSVHFGLSPFICATIPVHKQKQKSATIHINE